MKRRKVIHVCAACKAQFKTKRECWWHMDTSCQVIEKRRLLNEDRQQQRPDSEHEHGNDQPVRDDVVNREGDHAIRTAMVDQYAKRFLSIGAQIVNRSFLISNPAQRYGVQTW